MNWTGGYDYNINTTVTYLKDDLKKLLQSFFAPKYLNLTSECEHKEGLKSSWISYSSNIDV